MTVPSSQFQSIHEDDEFFALFPHRYDYIWADYPDPKSKTEWKTESRHPLSDRLIQQGSYLYGVRFGAETQYCLLDVDIGSPYHPKQDVFAIPRIVAALEPLGLVSYVACTSSYSGGLHLYFPFQQSQSSWKLAIAVTTLIENAGFKLKPGHLEVFPDPKPYSVTGKLSLFNAHRLPLQIGSYLLDDDLQPIWSTRQSFVQEWRCAQCRNDVEHAMLRCVLKQVKRCNYAVSVKAEKFINDLNAEIEFGWTGFGQTNYLLGRITMREYIFHHVLVGGKPLEGKALVDAAVDVARSLPGYSEYCRHQHEIEHRVEEWACCIENSHYFHYGDASGKFNAKLENIKLNNPELDGAINNAPTWNQQQSEEARDRIRRAIADLLEQEALPSFATLRFRALLQYGIGGQTLYRHRDLWHPAHLVESRTADGSTEVTEVAHVESPPHPPALSLDSVVDCLKEASTTQYPPSLFLSDGSDSLPGLTSSDSVPQSSITPGSNSRLTQIADPISEVKGVRYVQQILLDIQVRQGTQKEVAQLAHQQHQWIKQEVAEARYKARMQQFLNSGDPILIAEALAWAQVNAHTLPTPPLTG